MSHPKQLDESLSILSVVGGIFTFYSNVNRKFCKQEVKTLIRCHTLWRLIWICTICVCPIKRPLGFIIWVKYMINIDYFFIKYPILYRKLASDNSSYQCVSHSSY